MMRFLSEHFAPGESFGWLCLISLTLIPVIWVRFRRTRREPSVRFSSVAIARTLGATWAYPIAPSWSFATAKCTSTRA